MIPYEFTGVYDVYEEGLYTNAADKRHIYLMHELLCLGQFDQCIEIGCYRGASSSAFLESLKSTTGHVAFVDNEITPQLTRMCAASPYQNRIRIFPAWSQEFLARDIDYDCIFVDGNHNLPSVAIELKYILPRRPRCIMGHDTNLAAVGFAECGGAHLLKQTLFLHPDYYCIEDTERREHEWTERGFFFATTDHELFQLAKDAFRKWCIEYQPAAEVCV